MLLFESWGISTTLSRMAYKSYPPRVSGFVTQRHKLRAMHYIVIASSLQGNNIDNSWASSQVVLAIWILDILLRFVECMDYSSKTPSKRLRPLVFFLPSFDACNSCLYFCDHSTSPASDKELPCLSQRPFEHHHSTTKQISCKCGLYCGHLHDV